jgi:hypothetical protein
MLLFLTDMPLQNRLSQQISQHWRPFQDLKQTFAVARRAKQLRLRTQPRIIATAEDCILRTEMTDLESQEEDAPRHVLSVLSNAVRLKKKNIELHNDKILVILMATHMVKHAGIPIVT